MKIIGQGSELNFSVYSFFWVLGFVPGLWLAVCWGRKILFPGTAATFTKSLLDISEVTEWPLRQFVVDTVQKGQYSDRTDTVKADYLQQEVL